MQHKTKFEIDADNLSHDELKKIYRGLLESRNGLKKHNDALTKWASKINEAVTALATDGSLAFQAMAEKAGVRGHPSVTEAVRLFDAISHPQWRHEPIPKFEWPTDWRFEDDGRDGDADMQLNSPIAAAIEALKSLQFDCKLNQWKVICEAVNNLQMALERGIEGIKERHGFKTFERRIPTGKHPNDMNAEELREIVWTMSSVALDLAQDMDFAGFMLRRDLRAATYRRVTADLGKMAWVDFERAGPDQKFFIKVVGGEQEPF